MLAAVLSILVPTSRDRRPVKPSKRFPPHSVQSPFKGSVTSNAKDFLDSLVPLFSTELLRKCLLNKEIKDPLPVPDNRLLQSTCIESKDHLCSIWSILNCRDVELINKTVGVLNYV
jgi:hypothetical protein